jgi:transposase-like protein
MNPRKSQKITERDGLSYKQHQAVAEFLKPSNKSYEDVARALGISSRCLYNWRKEPKFQKALQNGVKDLKDRVLSAAEFSTARFCEFDARI